MSCRDGSEGGLKPNPTFFHASDPAEPEGAEPASTGERQLAVGLVAQTAKLARLGACSGGVRPSSRWIESVGVVAIWMV